MHSGFEFSKILLSKINIEDRTFLFSFPKRNIFLKESIKKLGLLQPPILLKTDNEYKIIAGEGRILALIELGFEEVHAFITQENNPKKLLFISFESNAFRTLNLVEKADFFEKVLKFFSIEEAISFLPLLGFTKHYSWMEFLKGINKLISEFKELLVKEELNPRVIQLIAILSEQEQKKLLNFYQKIKPSFSEQRKILHKLFDLKKRYSFNTILPDFLMEILKEEDFNIRKKRFLEEVFRLYYPNYSKKLEEIQPYIEKFKTRGIFVSPCPYFEKKELEVRLNILSEEDTVKIDFLKENLPLISKILRKI